MGKVPTYIPSDAGTVGIQSPDPQRRAEPKGKGLEVSPQRAATRQALRSANVARRPGALDQVAKLFGQREGRLWIASTSFSDPVR